MGWRPHLGRRGLAGRRRGGAYPRHEGVEGVALLGVEGRGTPVFLLVELFLEDPVLEEVPGDGLGRHCVDRWGEGGGMGWRGEGLWEGGRKGECVGLGTCCLIDEG